MAVNFSRSLVKTIFLKNCLPLASFRSSSVHLGINESVHKAESVASKYKQHVDEAVSRWSKNDEIYFGKERDTENFPSIKYAEFHPKVRFGFLPDSWFQAFYPKTGVTGPYMFLFGSSMFLLNKEIWVVDPHFVELGFFVVLLTYLIKKVGPMIAKRTDDELQVTERIRYYNPMEKLHGHLDRTVSTANEEIARAAVVSNLVKAKEENISLQLEAAYRERLQQAHRMVHRRLDYHVERENSRRRFQQDHMVNWVVDQVIKSITPSQEKETLNQCIGELKRIAQLSKQQQQQPGSSMA